MKTVSLIGTVHAEMGRANASELQAILERIHPEVIFIEAPAAWSQERLAIESPNRLETKTILKYQESNSAAAIPVDLPKPAASFFRNSEQLFDYVERVSDKYCRLMDKNKESTIAEGFSYLNSSSHAHIQAEIHSEIIRIIDMRGDPSLAHAYDAWRHQNHLRDIEMISNIEKYSRGNNFSRAAFLVGAAHRPSILKKLVELLLSGQTDTQWDY